MAAENMSDKPKLPMTVDSPIFWAEALIDLDTLKAFYEKRGIKCFMCDAAAAETFAQGAKVHEGGPYGAFNAEKVVEALNALAKEHPLDESKYAKPTLAQRMLNLLFPSEKAEVK